jgi:shikimate kinase
MDLPPRIYLTGFMASGKSTVGPLLAREIGYRFIDLDAYVEAREGQSLADLFAHRGEAAFRAAERAALEETTRMTRVVVSTGGGTLATEANLQTALGAGAVVQLRAPLALVLRRLRRGRLRPLLLDARGERLNGPALDARVQELLAARGPFYARAHLTVDSTAGPPRAIARTLVRALAAHFPS